MRGMRGIYERRILKILKISYYALSELRRTGKDLKDIAFVEDWL